MSLFDYLLQICHHYQHICRKDSQNAKQTKYLLPKNPTLFILHLFEEEIFERVERRPAGKTIINVLIIRIRFEPEFITVRKEDQAKEQKDENESERRLSRYHLTTKDMSMNKK